jgi:hypothetical protein
MVSFCTSDTKKVTKSYLFIYLVKAIALNPNLLVAIAIIVVALMVESKNFSIITIIYMNLIP